MKHNSSSPLVLESLEGKILRTYSWDSPDFILIRRSDTGRVEAHSEVDSLKSQNIDFQLIQRSKTSEILSAGVKIPKLGTVKSLGSVETLEFSPRVALEKDDDSLIRRVFGRVALVHIVTLFTLFSVYWIQTTFFKEKEVTVMVHPQTMAHAPVRKRNTVKASTKKINRKKKVGKIQKKRPRNRKSVSATKNIGALGALGGFRGGRNGATGLNLKSARNSTGSGNSAGLKSIGKNTSALAGKGLFSRSGGEGKVDNGTVGYGTRGRAGGKAGYGAMNIGGNSGGYDYPIQESGTVDGGLEKSQIEAVIRRNIGQVIYCYEKGLQTNPGLKGRVAMKFVINGQGRVRTAGVRNSSLKSSSVHACMEDKIKNWKFPKPHGNVDVKVNYPFVLKRASQR